MNHIHFFLAEPANASYPDYVGRIVPQHAATLSTTAPASEVMSLDNRLLMRVTNV